MGKKKFRFAVGAKNGPRSQSWGLSVSGSDIFLYTRSSNGLWQFSFHEGGRCHLKVGSTRDPRGHEYAHIRSREHDKLIITEGEFTPLLALSLFTNSLSNLEPVLSSKNVAFIRPAPEGKITRLLLLRNRIDERSIVNTIEKQKNSAKIVRVEKLANGESLYLLALEADGEFAGFQMPPSLGRNGWISPPGNIPRYEYTGRITMLWPSREKFYDVWEYGGSYLDEPEFTEESRKFFSDIEAP